jgi:ABC-2 type transport system permease protein
MFKLLKEIFRRMPSMAFMLILIRKEILQISKDRSVLAVVLIQPLVLVIIYGYAIRMDVKPIETAIVCDYGSEVQKTLADEFLGSAYYDATVVGTLGEARDLLYSHKVNNIIAVDPGFDDALAHGTAQIMIFQNGSEAQLAELSRGYINSTISSAASKLGAGSSGITVVSRNWFNEANTSSWFLLSGQYIAIITLVCSFLGSFVIAREWDRGTMESLAGTMISALELVLSKVMVYFILGFTGAMVTLIFGQLLLDIPLRGSVVLLVLLIAVYSFEMICFGVLISALCKNQFLASEYAIIIGCLPTVLLSGMIFDLRGVAAGIRAIGNAIPPTYAVEAMRVLFLSGGDTQKVLLDTGLQLIYALLFLFLAVCKVHRDCK